MTNPTDSHFAHRPAGNYDVIVALFCAFLLISNVAATKLIQFGPDVEVFGFPVLPIITDGGAFLFPLTYILGDVLAEVFGLKGARRAILIGFAVSILASVVFLVVGAAPPAADWGGQDAFTTILGFVPRIVLASGLAYLAGQFLNAFVLVRLKERSKEGSLWARLLGSTLVGEAADTVIFCVVAFGGVVGLGTLGNYIIVGYVYKVLVEVIMLPVTYRVVKLVKQHEPTYRPAA
ncbi:queuosine precursor transporter [Tessaracoccus terricola]